MLIKSSRPTDVKTSEITDESLFLRRRSIVKMLGLGLPALAGGALARPGREIYQAAVPPGGPAWLQGKLEQTAPGPYSTGEVPAPWNVVTSYNNFYEFGTGKNDPAENARSLITDPWQIEISGEAEITGSFTLEDILKPHPLQERVYRLHCVEAWSMVVPWVGFPLADLLKRFNPTSNAKYVRFETLYDPDQMPEQASRFSFIDYPYVEGLRIDEAMNELSFLAVGLYGRAMPNQNGAPIRLVVPWKYGFKSIKSIVRIEFTSRRPRTTWEKSAPREYGFYANVNPEVNHPRWSQATERRLPGSLFGSDRMETLKFNGYAEQVAHLYTGMNLSRDF